MAKVPVHSYRPAASNQNTTTWCSSFGAGRLNASTISEAVMQCTARVVGRWSDLLYRITANTIAATSSVVSRVDAGNGLQALSIASTTTGVIQDTSHGDITASGGNL